MNVLIISGILPVPDLLRMNDFVVQYCKAMKKKYNTINFYLMLPLGVNPFSSTRRKAHRLKEYDLSGFRVMILPHISFRRFRNFHTLIASSIYLFNRKRIKRFFAETQIDLVHAEYILPDGLLAYWLHKNFSLPYLVRSHNELWYFPHRIASKICKKIMTHAAYVLPLNHHTASFYRSFVQTPIEVVPHGIDDNFLTIKKTSENKIVNIITLSVLIKLKRHDRVLRALTKLKEEGLDFSFTIAGDGPERGYLEKTVSELHLQDRVCFVGRVDYKQVPGLLAKHDIFIMVSYFETFGRVFFEAMAAGLPVICSRNNGIHGYFSEGVEGMAVDHNNLDEITNALRILILDPEKRRNMGNRGKELVTRFTEDNIAERFHAYYSAMLKAAQPLRVGIHKKS